MLKKFTLAAALAALSVGAVKAQSPFPYRCGHDEEYHKLLARDPLLKAREDQLEAEINRQLSGMNLSQFFKTTGLATDSQVLRIPIVFHIIHANYDNTRDYISDERVYQYVREVNAAFNRRSADTNQVISLYRGNVPGTRTRYHAKSNIEFHLAQRDPNGQPTNGITRRRHYLANGGDNLAKFDGWAPDSYLNVWIVNDFSVLNMSGGFSYQPAGAAGIPYYDGPIIPLARQQYNANRDNTIAHEIGHSLNLAHTFGNANTTTAAGLPCGDDNVDDTPPTNGGGNGGGGSGCNDAINLNDSVCTQSTVNMGRINPDPTDSIPDRVANRGITFYARTRVVLRTVDIYPSDTVNAPFTINLRRNGTLVQSYSGTVTASGIKQTVPLNFVVQPDSPYTLTFGTNPNARRDSVGNGVLGNQLSIPGALTVTDYSTGGLYNYFYKLSVQYGYFKIYNSATTYTLYDDTGRVTPRYVDGGFLVDYPDTVNAQNIMDYQDCSKMFTNGQALRMRAAMRSNVAGRNRLIDSANQVRTGIRIGNNFPAPSDLSPVADFSIANAGGSAPVSEKVYICPGNTVTFVNRTWRDTTATANWSFNGGGAANFNDTAKVSIAPRFFTPGPVAVTLAVTGNGNTGSSTITKQRAIYVADTASRINDPITYWTEFNPSSEQLDRLPIFNYYNNEYAWGPANTGYYDGFSMRYTAYDARNTPAAFLIGSPQGDYDDFFMPPVNLSGFNATDTLNLTYMHSGATRTTVPNDMNDIFEIAYSANCGDSWTTFKTMTKNELHNVGALPYAFTPGSGYMSTDWTYSAFRVPAAARVANALFRFRYRPGALRDGSGRGSGNNFYIDRIHFSAFPAGINETQVSVAGFSLAPNPTRGGATVSIKGAVTGATLTVTDVTGKVVYTSAKPNATPAYTSFDIPAQSVAAKGIYFVRVGQGTSAHTEKLVVY